MRERFGNEWAPGVPYTRGQILVEGLHTLAVMLPDPASIRRRLLGDP